MCLMYCLWNKSTHYKQPSVHLSLIARHLDQLLRFLRERVTFIPRSFLCGLKILRGSSIHDHKQFIL